jgi:Ca2+:H+ antiporter
VPEVDVGDQPGASARRGGLKDFLFSGEGWPYVLVPFIPVAVALELAHAASALIFTTSAIGVIPTAALMGRATEELAERAGPGIGGLMNVTFGNLPELMIAFFALRAGLHEVVKASVIGSVLGNCLLVLGASMLVGGIRHSRQWFSARAARSQSTMLLLAAVALVMPAILVLGEGESLPAPGSDVLELGSTVNGLSFTVAIVLLAAYGASLFFSLSTHRELFNPADEEAEEVHHTVWSVKRSVILLAISGLAVGLMAEILVGSIEHTAESVGLSEFFIGAVIVAIVGNAAEHWVAVYVAWKDKMDLAVNIAIGSAAQVALFVGPLLVVLSFFVGPGPLPLAFSGFEIGALLLAAIVAGHITSEGESTWFDGLMLLSVYAVVVATFLFA